MSFSSRTIGTVCWLTDAEGQPGVFVLIQRDSDLKYINNNRNSSKRKDALYLFIHCSWEIPQTRVQFFPE